MKAEELIALALKSAQEKGVIIKRGYIFDWSKDNNGLPFACNAIGSVLLYLGKADMARGGFHKEWSDKVCEALGEQHAWLWRFLHGWDYGNCLSFTVEEKGKEKVFYDEVSKNANKLALRWIK